MMSWVVIVVAGSALLAVHLVLMVACAPLVRGGLVAGVARVGGGGGLPVLARWRLILSCAVSYTHLTLPTKA